MAISQSTLVPILALLLVQLIFGFNFAASKVILAHFPPLLWSAIRVAIAAIVMFSVSFAIVPKELRRYDLKFLKPVLIYAIFGMAFSQAFFLLGLQYTTTSNSAILNTMTPIFTLGFAILFKREKWTFLRGGGFIVAVLGVLVLKNVESFQFSFDTLKGDIYTLLNCASLAFFFAISRDFLKQNSTIWVTAWMFFLGAILLGIASIPDLSVMQFPVPYDGTLVAAILYNVIGATVITYFLNSWTLTKVKSSSVAIFIYLQPVIAVLNEWVTYHQVPSLRTVLAMFLIFSGVGLGLVKAK